MKNWNYIEGAKTGNAGITDKEFNSESEMRRWCIEHNYTYTPVGGGYYRLEDDSGKNRKDLEAHVKAGNKTGNIKDDAKAKELHKKMMDAKEIAEEWGRASNYQKKDNLEGGRKAAEDAYRKAKKEYEDYAMNSKTGNELPWGSGINIPKTKGNYTFPDPKEIEKKIQEAIKRGESPAFIEGMKDVLKKAKDERNKRTGNDTPLEYAHRKPKVINDDKTGAEEFFKQLSDDVKEREKKDDADIEKVGNQSPQERLNKDLSIIKEECRKKGISLSFSELAKELEKYGWDFNELRKLKLPVSVGNAKTGNIQYHKVGKISIRLEANDDDWTVYDADGNELKSGKGGLGQAKTWAEHFARFTNKKAGNANLETSVEKGKLGLWNWYVHKDGTIVSGGTSSTEANAKEMARKALEKEKVGNVQIASDYYDIKQESNGKFYIYVNGGAKTYGPYSSKTEAEEKRQQILAQRNKTGNRVIEKESEMSQELKNLLKKAPEWIKEKIQYAFSHGFTIDEKDFINAIKKEVGNSASEYEILKQDPSKMHPMYKKAYEEALKKLSNEDEEFKKRFEREYGVKAKNEKSDDKFAYVMREFDEGKLKTPDGKVVTDPAQAKAIAYSESKKTENGLARARKAIK